MVLKVPLASQAQKVACFQYSFYTDPWTLLTVFLISGAGVAVILNDNHDKSRVTA